MMDSLIGQTIGPYKIVEKIGEGGMAVVYKGYQQSLNRYVAIKTLRAELAQDEQFVARFRREALAVAELNHPNILHVYDAGVAYGLYYIVMAYVDGGSLRDLIAQGPLEIEYAVSIAAQIADALDHAHRQGIIHRDVKPNNILISRDGRPLLTDFGIAKALHESQGLTRTGMSIGTPEYMAPEQIQGQQVDGRTDIYALGNVLYEMLVGWAPFATTTPVAALYKQVNEPPPPIRQANIHVPAWLEAIVNKALAKRPQDRFHTAGELAQALRERRIAERVRTPTPTPVPVTGPLPERAVAKRKPAKSPVPLIIAGIAVLLVLVIAAAAVLLLGGGGGPAQNTPKAITITRIITPTPLPTVPMLAPALLTPRSGDRLTGKVRFQWMWTNRELENYMAFDLRIWSRQEQERAIKPRAASLTREMAVDVDLDSLPTIREHGPGTYFWTVVIVDTGTGRVVSPEGEVRSFTYARP